MNQERVKEIFYERLKTYLSEQDNQGSVVPVPEAPTPSQPPQEQKPTKTVVKFETNTETPFEVIFTERGFLIGETRMSFEELEKALSKGYDIVMDKGNGLHLNQVRMQKILKYKDRF